MNFGQCFTKSIQQFACLGPCEKVKNDLTVTGGLEDGALPFELFSKGTGVDQVSIVHKRDRSVGALYNNGLCIAFGAVAGCRVSGMADCVVAL